MILRRGQEVARLVPPDREVRRFPDLTEFRRSIGIKGETVIRQRREARY